jgi:hypothetical protein
VKVNPVLRDPYRFYPKFATMVLRFIFRRHLQPDTDRVVIFTDSLPVKKRKESVEKAIKKACRDELGGHIPFASYHHPRASNSWIQASDYCSWAVYRKWHRGDARSYHQLRTRLAEPELDVLARGTTRYY